MKYKNFDQYIDNSAAFAQPILKEIRFILHEACQEIKEEFKWSFPNYTYKGKILCHMAAFKGHATFGFWLGSIMTDPAKIFVRDSEGGMGHFGKMQSLDDLPDRNELISYVHEAMALIDEGKTLPIKKESIKKELIVPVILLTALEKSHAAKMTFEKFSYSHKKEYVEWILEAKTETTRTKRVQQTIEWLSEGKTRNWKYAKK